MIRFDRATRSVVVMCTSCGARDVFLRMSNADQWAIDHVYRAHSKADDDSGDRERAIQASSLRRRRGIVD